MRAAASRAALVLHRRVRAAALGEIATVACPIASAGAGAAGLGMSTATFTLSFTAAALALGVAAAAFALSVATAAFALDVAVAAFALSAAFAALTLGVAAAALAAAVTALRSSVVFRDGQVRQREEPKGDGSENGGEGGNTLLHDFSKRLGFAAAPSPGRGATVIIHSMFGWDSPLR